MKLSLLKSIREWKWDEINFIEKHHGGNEGMHCEQLNERNGFMVLGKSPNDSEIISQSCSISLISSPYFKEKKEIMKLIKVYSKSCLRSLLTSSCLMSDWFDPDWISGLWLDFDQFDCVENQISLHVNSCDCFGFRNIEDVYQVVLVFGRICHIRVVPGHIFTFFGNFIPLFGFWKTISLLGKTAFWKCVRLLSIHKWGSLQTNSIMPAIGNIKDLN